MTDVIGNHGWLCPACGSAHAPWVVPCPSNPRLVPRVTPRAIPRCPRCETTLMFRCADPVCPNGSGPVATAEVAPRG